jgi:rubrerythrin
MVFSTTKEVLDWFTKDERILTPSFLATIPWGDVGKYALDPMFVPIITYMRDVETYTKVYYEEMCESPTGRDPHVRAFMDRWATEEPLHGELLNRFMEEVGVKAQPDWKKEIMRVLTVPYHISRVLRSAVTGAFGKHFSAVHMTWGAINEQSTLIGYRRLWELAKHPVLEYILRAIVREEARHAFFYWNVARINMINSPFRQGLSKYVIDRFWSPVGQGLKKKVDTDVVIRTLFKGADGLALMKALVSDRIRQLPGMEELTAIDDRIADIALQ